MRVWEPSNCFSGFLLAYEHSEAESTPSKLVAVQLESGKFLIFADSTLIAPGFSTAF